jgi:hypothetical protein
LNQTEAHVERLTDALLDGTIDRELFERRKNAVLTQENGLKGRLAALEAGKPEDGLVHLEKFLELVNTASFLYKHGLPEEKRDLVKKVTSNLLSVEKNVVVELKNEAKLLAERTQLPYSSPYKGVPRTWDKILAQLLKYFADEVAPAN